MLRKVIFVVLLCFLTAGAEDSEPIRFRLQQRHIDELRKVKISWDGTEIGAPCFDLSREYSQEMLYALQIAFLFGELEPGSYPYNKPEGEFVEYSPLVVEEMPRTSIFHFSSDHRELLRQSSIEDSEVGWDGETVPGCDPKRPYGNFTYYQLEMAQHLGRPTTVNDEGNHEISEETEEELTRLHHSMQAAWQVFLENFELQPGDYVGDEWGNWEPVKR